MDIEASVCIRHYVCKFPGAKKTGANFQKRTNTNRDEYQKKEVILCCAHKVALYTKSAHYY